MTWLVMMLQSVVPQINRKDPQRFPEIVPKSQPKESNMSDDFASLVNKLNEMSQRITRQRKTNLEQLSNEMRDILSRFNEAQRKQNYCN